MYELKVVTHFSAAHRLTMVGAKCENMHGHNWKIEVCVAGEKLDKAGILVDFGVLKKHVAEIMSMVDHQYLNDLEHFRLNQPSSENIAFFVARHLQEKMATLELRVSRVTAWESENACATYIVSSGS